MIVHDIDQAFGCVKAALAGSGKSYKQICDKSGVSIPTFRQWTNGNSTGARLDSIIRVLEACGWEIDIRRKDGKA